MKNMSKPKSQRRIGDSSEKPEQADQLEQLTRKWKVMKEVLESQNHTLFEQKVRLQCSGIQIVFYFKFSYSCI